MNALENYLHFLLKFNNQPLPSGVDNSLADFEDFMSIYRASVSQKKLGYIDQRFQDFIKKEFEGYLENHSLPNNILELDKAGLAALLSLPKNSNEYHSGNLDSYRTMQGVMHNTVNDRRTTKGVFHVSDGGLPIAADKTEVPKRTFSKLFEKALHSNKIDLELPYTYKEEYKAQTFLSLLLKPKVVPDIEGIQTGKKMMVRFIAPGSLAANLSFVENIFGNGGNTYLEENNIALHPNDYTGHMGFVILAPHLTEYTKYELGLPHADEATEKQKRQGVYYTDKDEKYNNGSPFKITYRTEEGIVITLIADNYFGYCKKEVKTQISFAANLHGSVEEEHAGGAIIFPRYHLGSHLRENGSFCNPGEHTYNDLVQNYQAFIDFKKEGYGVDKNYPQIIYTHEKAKFYVDALQVRWPTDQGEYELRLEPDKTYIHPSGYKINLEKHPFSEQWYLVGTQAEGLLCHKPFTVSGGGKSEISKPLEDIIIYKSFYVSDMEKDFNEVQKIFDTYYGDRYKDSTRNKGKDFRPVLSSRRTLGSVIKLLTPSYEYTDSYNEWLSTIRPDIKNLVFLVKRFYQKVWGDHWREHFQVDYHDGYPGNELKLENKKLNVRYLRVGVDEHENWMTYRLRSDFIPAQKVQVEDDITCSEVLSFDRIIGLNPALKEKPYKFVENCETMLFQRPDESVHKGIDKNTEIDFSREGLFAANYEPLTREHALKEMNNIIEYYKYTQPMQDMIKRAAKLKDGEFFTSTSQPRIVDGAPTKNVRYLQKRLDLQNPFDTYLTKVGAKLKRKLPGNVVPQFPMGALLMGRRNNAPDAEAGIKGLSVYNPLHYQELPEAFMDILASLSGKSPSTTGFGSEGALTKGPFNALRPITDLNNTLVSLILTEQAVFSTPAGFIGKKTRIDHDISFLIPELWSRMSEEERDPDFLIQNNYLEKIPNKNYGGKDVEASRLGYRITSKFVSDFMGKIFSNPDQVFNEEILKPELNNEQEFYSGMAYICESQKAVAQGYFDDDSIDIACPPLKALLHIMCKGEYKGMTIDSLEFRNMFNKKEVLHSAWYQNRLLFKQKRDIRYWQEREKELSKYTNHVSYGKIKQEIEESLAKVKSTDYIDYLQGTLGADPIYEL